MIYPNKLQDFPNYFKDKGPDPGQVFLYLVKLEESFLHLFTSTN